MNYIKTITTIEDRNKFDGSLIYQNNEFEKKTGRVKFLKAREEDSKLWFIDNLNMCIKEEYKEQRSCPICATSEFELSFNKDGFNHVKCEKCDFIFVSPVLTDKALIKYYENENKWTQVMLSDEERRVNKIMYELALSFLEKENKFNSKELLDVGSGSGYFLEVAKERGWSVKGIEFNKDMIELSNKNSLNVDNHSLEDLFKRGEKFDVISSWFVLEHIKDIKSFIRDIELLLKEGGLLLLAVPQLDSLANRLYWENSPTFAGYAHINFFNLDSINNFITSFKFELVAQETQVTQLNNIKKYFTQLTTKN